MIYSEWLTGIGLVILGVITGFVGTTTNADFIKPSSLNDFYRGFLAAASTDTGLVDPASSSHFTW